MHRIYAQRLIKNIYAWKPIPSRRKDRPESMCEGDILNDLTMKEL